jgi:hypothetical protein
MGRGGSAVEASTNSLLFGVRNRGNGPVPIITPLITPIVEYRVQIPEETPLRTSILQLAELIAPGPSAVQGVPGMSLDWLDVCASSDWTHARTGRRRKLHFGIADTGSFGAAVIEVDAAGQRECLFVDISRYSGELGPRAFEAVVAGPSGIRRSKFWQPLVARPATPSEALAEAQATEAVIRRRWNDHDWPNRKPYPGWAEGLSPAEIIARIVDAQS